MTTPKSPKIVPDVATAAPLRRRKGKGYTLGSQQPFQVPPGAVWITAKQVCERYGGRSLMWLWRKVRDDANFPRPAYFGRLQFFKMEELEAYERAIIAEPPQRMPSREPLRVRRESAET